MFKNITKYGVGATLSAALATNALAVVADPAAPVSIDSFDIAIGAIRDQFNNVILTITPVMTSILLVGVAFFIYRKLHNLHTKS